MYYCLLLHHKTIHNDTKLMLLKTLLENIKHSVKSYNPPFEISYHTIDEHTVFSMGKNLSIEALLQAGIYCASTDILTAIGYSTTREKALIQALEHLSRMLKGREIRVYI